jgi:hypothetical protein
MRALRSTVLQCIDANGTSLLDPDADPEKGIRRAAAELSDAGARASAIWIKGITAAVHC